MLPKRIGREVIYESDWVSLYADRVQYPDGHILERHHYIHFEYESVAVVIQNEKGEVLLIKSNRYITQSEEWEIPAGRVEKGESLAEGALREVFEETGYALSTPELFYKYNTSNGISDQRIFLYKATALKKKGQHDPREVMETRWVSKEGIRDMLRGNEIRCGLSLAGLTMVLFCGL